MDDRSNTPPLEVWAGIECTVNRVGDRYFDQVARSGHHRCDDDLDLIASLRVTTVRYPVLWAQPAIHRSRNRTASAPMGTTVAFHGRPMGHRTRVRPTPETPRLFRRLSFGTGPVRGHRPRMRLPSWCTERNRRGCVDHCAEALNKGVSISAVLDEDSEEPTTLYGVFFVKSIAVDADIEA